jgi:NAD(P)-dependent dehydrogenase (short-subunit alcohol dehydrogenase family)
MCASVLWPHWTPAAKAAQAHVCATMRAELGPHGIEVASVHPIVTRTEFVRSIARRQGRNVNGDCLPPHCLRFMVQQPIRVARAVVRCLQRPTGDAQARATRDARRAAVNPF